MSLRFRKHIRLAGHDYMQGSYFLTLCTRYRMQLFGRITGTGATAHIELTDVGRIVDECWRTIPDHFQHVRLGEMQIMPDHLHAILMLEHRNGNGPRETTKWVATTDAMNENTDRPNGPRRGSLGAIIGAFKSETTKRANRLKETKGQPLWQPNYHERIIREYHGEQGRIARYIVENPTNWR